MYKAIFEEEVALFFAHGYGCNILDHKMLHKAWP